MLNVSAPPVAAELIERQDWFVRLRWLAIISVTIAVELVPRLTPVRLATAPLCTILTILAAFNLLLQIVLRKTRRGKISSSRIASLFHNFTRGVVLAPVFLLKIFLLFVLRLEATLNPRLGGPAGPDVGKESNPLTTLLVARELWGMDKEGRALEAASLASSQISVDFIALAALVHYSGGIENPFVFYAIFHVIISSILLSRPATFLQASLCFGLLAGVAMGELGGFLPHYSLGILGVDDAYRQPFYVATQLFVLGSTLYLSCYLATSITSHLRSFERESFLLSQELALKAENLEAAYSRLAEIERTKSQYMRKVSHELRGPLGTIQMALSVVLEGLAGEIPEKSRDMILRAQRRAGELASVTQDLLLLSSAREGRLSIEKSAVDLVGMTKELVAEHRDHAEKKGIRLTAEIAEDIPLFKGEPVALAQMIGNLLSNAVRYTPSGGAVQLRLSRYHDAIRIEVSDTGIGIPLEDQGRVFEEFFRAPNARAHAADGTGLGLSIVRAAADQHGGTVILDSTPGQGTRFAVDLPLG